MARNTQKPEKEKYTEEDLYYGEKIENQTEKKKMELIGNRTVINSLFYEGLGAKN